MVRKEKGITPNTKPVRITSSPSLKELNTTKLSAKEAREYAESIINAVREPLIVLDRDLRVVSASRSFYEVFKVKPEDTVGQLIYDMGNKQWNIPKLRELLETVLPQKAIFNDYEVDHDFPTIGRRIMLLNARRIPSPPENLKVILLAIEDITERKKIAEAAQKLAEKHSLAIEKALVISEETLRLVMDPLHVGIALTDLKGTILNINKALILLYGSHSQDEVLGKNILEFVEKIDYTRALEKMSKVAVGEEFKDVEFILLRADGSKFQAELSASIIKDAAGVHQGIMVLVRDISERNRVEQERQRADKLGSIGTLAGGIAHDFNNIITGILGNIQLANGYLKQNKAETAEEMLDEAERASLRAKDLTQQLLTFSKGGVSVKNVILVDQLLRESVIFALRGSSVKPEFVIPDNLWAIEADKGQLNQVIGNIVINAKQAMPKGGIIKVSAGNEVVKRNNILLLPDGRYIKIDIEDHGGGITEENKGKIFDPYFTTKQKGSGLGLATSYSIIRNHGGYIAFDSIVDVGTTFHIHLPATDKKSEEMEKQAPAAKSLSLNHGRILVMDDEDTILTLLSRMLTGAGYEVELTADGSAALKKYSEAKKAGKPFDAVILDLTVPGGMGGTEVMRKLLEIDPHVKAIVSSGYATDPIMSDFKKYGFSGMVTKPYDIKQMQQTLGDMLTGN